MLYLPNIRPTGQTGCRSFTLVQLSTLNCRGKTLDKEYEQFATFNLSFHHQDEEEVKAVGGGAVAAAGLDGIDSSAVSEDAATMDVS
jgi:hypothetical protein